MSCKQAAARVVIDGQPAAVLCMAQSSSDPATIYQWGTIRKLIPYHTTLMVEETEWATVQAFELCTRQSLRTDGSEPGRGARLQFE